MSVCPRCQHKRSALGRCRCSAVQRGWKARGRFEPKPVNLTSGGHQVANAANRGHKWCSCGALVRNGACVSRTCGKTQ